MSAVSVPSDAQAILANHIHTHDQLHVLLHLHEKRVAQDVDRIATATSIEPGPATSALEHLVRRGLVALQAEGAFVYAPQTPELDHGVDELAKSYREKPFEVLTLMSTNAVDRVRAAAIQTFADAFLVGRKRDG